MQRAFHQLNIEVDIRIDDIILALIENQKAHAIEYKEAIEGFLKTVAEKTAELQKIVDAGGPVKNLLVSVSAPVNNDRQYTNMIEMFRATKRAGKETITLTTLEYDQILNDNWDWAVQAKTLNSTYSASALRSLGS